MTQDKHIWEKKKTYPNIPYPNSIKANCKTTLEELDIPIKVCMCEHTEIVHEEHLSNGQWKRFECALCECNEFTEVPDKPIIEVVEEQ